MRILNAVAALSGVTALMLLLVASHHMQDAAPGSADNVRLAGLVQLISAGAGIAIANRAGRLALIAGALIVGGAILFSIAVSSHNLLHTTALLMLAPVSGVAMMLGWLALAFAPSTKGPE